MDRLKQKAELIEALAEFLTKDAAMLSMRLSTGDRAAQQWADLRRAANLYGWVTKEETQAHLTELLG